MYSEFTQQLNVRELESIKDSLQISTATHVRWISKINQSLVCQQEHKESQCADNNPPHRNCSFTRWYSSITNQSVLDDPSFIKLISLHEQLHLKACELVATLSAKKLISADEYSKFSEIEYEFFNIQSSIIEECTESLGTVDSLTKLPNKRALHEILLQEENRIKRNKFSSIISIVGIDDFKTVNQEYGYIAGDLLLIQLAALFKNSLRNFDTVARYSGDKFILYLPETDLMSAEVILERFRQSIENTNFEISAGIGTKITCTFGLSHLDSELSTEQGLSNAWDSLNAAISKGRNSVGADGSNE